MLEGGWARDSRWKSAGIDLEARHALYRGVTRRGNVHKQRGHSSTLRPRRLESFLSTPHGFLDGDICHILIKTRYSSPFDA